MDTSITILKSLRSINIIDFNEILETQNTLLLIKGYDESVQYSDEAQIECNQVWINLFDEYFKLKNDGRAVNSIKKNIDKTKLRGRISMVQQTIDIMLSLKLANEIKPTNELAEIKIKALEVLFSFEKGFARKVSVMDSFSDIFDKLMLLHKRYTDDFNLVNKRVEQVSNKEVSSIYKAIINIQNVLGYSLGDLENLKVPLYLELEKSAVAKINAQKKGDKKCTTNR